MILFYSCRLLYVEISNSIRNYIICFFLLNIHTKSPKTRHDTFLSQDNDVVSLPLRVDDPHIIIIVRVIRCLYCLSKYFYNILQRLYFWIFLVKIIRILVSISLTTLFSPFIFLKIQIRKDRRRGGGFQNSKKTRGKTSTN